MFELKDSETGEVKLRLANPEFLPLDFQQLVEAVDKKRSEVPATVSGLECDGNGMESGGRIDVKTKVVLHERAPFFCLVKGGVVPPRYLLCKTNVKFLLDRNAVGKIQQQDTEAGKQAKELDKPGSTFDPAFAALEGADQRVPSLDEFKSEYEKFHGQLCQVFESAVVLPVDEARLKVLHQFQKQYVEPEFNSEMTYLEKVAKLVAQTVKKENVPDVAKKLLDLTSELGFPQGSFLFVAVVSVLYGHPASSGNAARKVLKPKATMSAAQLYNVVADLGQLKMLTISLAMVDADFALLTDDTGLAMLWAGLNVVGANETDSGMQYHFSPNPALFAPAEFEEIKKLIQ